MTTSTDHRNWQRFWKFYFWFFTILMFAVKVRQLLEGFKAGFYGGFVAYFLFMLSFIISVINIICLYSYAYKLRMFSALFWEIFFVIYSASLVSSFITSFSGIRKEYFSPPTSTSLAAVFLAILIVIPSIIAVYLYAFKFFKGRGLIKGGKRIVTFLVKVWS
jgi:hypothetical protein